MKNSFENTNEKFTGSCTIYPAPYLVDSGIRVIQTQAGYRVENLDNDRSYELRFGESGSYVSIPSGSYSFAYETTGEIDTVTIRSLADAYHYDSNEYCPPIYPLVTIEAEADGNGSVTGPGSYEYDDNDVENDDVVLIAEAGPGSKFVGWFEEGESLGTDTVLTLPAERPHHVTAKFAYLASAPELQSLESLREGVELRWTAVDGVTWYRVLRLNEEGEWTNLADTGSTQYLDTEVVAGTSYTYCVMAVTGEGGPQMSDPSGEPQSVTANAGTTATFSVTADGAERYQWQYYNTNSKSWDNVTNSRYTGLHEATMTVPATTGRNGLQFRCAVTNAAGTTYTESATLTVTSTPKPSISSQPQNATAAAGGTATFHVGASNASSYQWQFYSTSSGNWENVTNSAYSGLKTATMTVPVTTSRNGLQFRCAVTNAAGTTYSNGATLTVISKPTITADPSSMTAAAGSTATFSVKASNAASYQWQYYAGSKWDNVTNSSYSGLKSATMTVPVTTGRNGLQFRCAVTNAAGTTYSNSATLTVTSSTKPTITAQPQNTTAAAGSTATFKVAASNASSYQWQYYTGSSWANVTNSAYTGLTTATMTVPATTGRNGLQFRCAVSNSYGTVYSSGATLTVTTGAPTITAQPQSVTAAAGTTATFKVTASGASTYQWQYYSSSGWANVTNSAYTGLTTATMTVPATTGRNGLQFRCAVVNAAGTTYSDSATLTVTSASKPTITAQPQDVTAAPGTTAKVSVTASYATSYQWQYSDNGGKSWGNITNSSYSGIKSATLGIPATTGRNGYLFRCQVTNSVGTTTSNAMKLTVTAGVPTIRTQPQNTTAAVGTKATFKVAADGATSYQWQYYTGSSWANVTNSAYGGLQSATMTVPATAGRNGLRFRCAVTNAAGTTYSNGATLTVK